MLDELESRQRYNDYLREVKRVQLSQQVKSNQSNLYQRMAIRLGNLLIVAGQYLKDKNCPQVTPVGKTA